MKMYHRVGTGSIACTVYMFTSDDAMGTESIVFKTQDIYLQLLDLGMVALLPISGVTEIQLPPILLKEILPAKDL